MPPWLPPARQRGQAAIRHEMGATAWLGLRAAASHRHPDWALALVKGEGLARGHTGGEM